LANNLLATFTDTPFAAIVQDAIAHAGCPVALWADNHDVRFCERRRHLNDAARPHWRHRTLVALYNIYALYHYGVIGLEHSHHATALPAVFAGGHFHLIP
jgi:hypothetical protein